MQALKIFTSKGKGVPVVHGISKLTMSKIFLVKLEDRKLHFTQCLWNINSIKK